MARRDVTWEVRNWTYIETSNPNWYDVLINGTNKYLNFNMISWDLWYGFRDNNGVMEYKDNWGDWTPFSWGWWWWVTWDNIYNTDWTLTANRILDWDNNTLRFQNLADFNIYWQDWDNYVTLMSGDSTNGYNSYRIQSHDTSVDAFGTTFMNLNSEEWVNFQSSNDAWNASSISITSSLSSITSANSGDGRSASYITTPIAHTFTGADVYVGDINYNILHLWDAPNSFYTDIWFNDSSFSVTNPAWWWFVYNVNSKIATFDISWLTSNRNFIYPDQNWNIALTSDIGIHTLNGVSAYWQWLNNGTTGTQPNWTTWGSTHTLHIPLASGTGVTSWTISKTQYDTFNAKVGWSWASWQISFWSGTGIQSGDNTLFWDNTNKRLGIGTASPSSLLHIKGSGVGDVLFGTWPNNSNYLSVSFNGNLTNYNLLGSSLDNTFRVGRPSGGDLYFTEANSPQMVIRTGGNVSIGAGAASSKLEISTNSLGTTQTISSGLALVNTTAAANGAQQISPAIRFSGSGRKTNATAWSQAVDFRNYLLPVQWVTNPSWILKRDYSVNGGSFADVLVIAPSTGRVSVFNGIYAMSLVAGYTGSIATEGSQDIAIAPNNTTAMTIANGGNVGIWATTSISSKLEVRTNSLWVTQTTSSGIALTNTTVSTVSLNQISPALRFSGSGWKTNATAGSQTVDIRNYLIPATWAANPSGSLVREASINAWAYTQIALLDTSGNMTLAGTVMSLGSNGTFRSSWGDTTLSSFATTQITANGTASTFALNNTGLTSLTGQTLTAALSTSLFELTQTWNTTGTPTAIKATITNTASNAASKIIDLIVGATSMFNITVDGTSTFGGKIIADNTVRLKWYTVATLPAWTQWDTAFVTDALAPTFLTTVVWWWAVVTTVFYNGTNWIAQ